MNTYYCAHKIMLLNQTIQCNYFKHILISSCQEHLPFLIFSICQVCVITSL
jgi:hypothetical protein